MSGKNGESTRMPARKLGLAAAALLTARLLVGAQDQTSKGNLAQQLQAAYRVTVMNKAGRVTQAGTVLVVKKEGIQANPPNQKYYFNDYDDGQITANAMSSALDALKGKAKDQIKPPFRRSKLDKKVDSRALAVDEKLYLLRMDVNPASVDFYVQSCGDSCKPDAPDPAHHPYLAEVSFHFNKGYQNSDFSQLQPGISAVLAVSDDTNASNDQGAQSQPRQEEAPAAAGPAQTQFAPIAPPEAPPAEPVQPGDTTGQVVAKLGKPSNTVRMDTKEIYIYKDLKVKVTFVKGQVTEVE
jgi:hypothetical protein